MLNYIDKNVCCIMLYVYCNRTDRKCNIYTVHSLPGIITRNGHDISISHFASQIKAADVFEMFLTFCERFL
jgi:hypothetical protein